MILARWWKFQTDGISTPRSLRDGFHRTAHKSFVPLLGGTNKDVIELPMSRVEANFLNEGNNMKDKYLIFFLEKDMSNGLNNSSTIDSPNANEAKSALKRGEWCIWNDGFFLNWTQVKQKANFFNPTSQVGIT